MRNCAIIHPLHLELETALLNQAGQVGALKFEAVCRFRLISRRVFQRLFDDVAAVRAHRFVIGEREVDEVFVLRRAAHGIQR